MKAKKAYSNRIAAALEQKLNVVEKSEAGLLSGGFASLDKLIKPLADNADNSTGNLQTGCSSNSVAGCGEQGVFN